MIPENIVPFDRRQTRTSKETPQWWHTELLEHTHDAVIVWELGGKGIIYWNRSAEMLYGWRREEALGRITHELLQTELAAGDTDDLESALVRYGTWVGELKHRTRTGEHILVETRIVLLPSVDDRWIVAEFNRDMSDRGRG
jgi:PAS domain S-box-containing protein